MDPVNGQSRRLHYEFRGGGVTSAGVLKPV